MKKVLFLTGALMIGALGMTACESTPNVNTNAARSAANSAMNTVAGAVNTVTNAVANTTAKVTTESPDAFLEMAAKSGMAEVEIGKLAASKSKNPEIKKYGQGLAADHEKVNAEIKALAGKKNFTLPTAADSDLSGLAELKKVQGEDFDKTFMEVIMKGHDDHVAAYQRQADNGTDADIKAFAAKTLPALKSHLERLKALQTRIASSAKMDN